MKHTKQERQESETYLRKFLSPGTTVYTVLRHVSRSGMQRRIDLYAIDRTDHRPVYLSGHAACFMGWRINLDKRGIVVNGCGMDMGFHLVYELSSDLFRSPDGTYSHEGAYALKQKWL